MADNRKRKLQLWRNNTPLASLSAAKNAISSLQDAADGEIVLARYLENNVVKSVMGIRHDKGGNTGWTFLQDVAESAGNISALQSELDATQSGAGLGDNGEYTPHSSNDIIGLSDSISDAVNDLADYVAGLDFDSMTQDNSEVVTLVTQENGLVDVDTTAVIDLELTGFVADQNAEGDVDEDDTLESAFNKINNRFGDVEDTFANMDGIVTVAVNNGDVVTMVSQTDGVVTANKANLSDVLLTGYSKTSDTGAIAATDSVEVALSKLENVISEIEDDVDTVTIHSNDQTVVVAPDATLGGTDVSVNIDDTTLVKSNSGVISSALKVIKVIPSGTASTDEVVDANLSTNVKEAYRLVYDGSTTAIGKQINIYKDSALKEVYLGASTDTIDSSTGVITKNIVTDPQSLNFAYQLADGTYSLVKVDVSAFLTEQEFGDGLQVSGAGVVSVLKDPTSENFLSVSSAGVKVSGVQTAINSSISTALENNIDGAMPISVSTSNGVTTISFVLKQHVDGEDSNDMITIDSSNGFILGTTWDCGEYEVASQEP